MSRTAGIILPERVEDPLALAERGGAWIGSVLQAATWAIDPLLPGANAHAAEQFGIESSSQVVVLLVDGLGETVLDQRFSYARTLRGLPDGPVHAQTCVPSTTSAALAAFTTGKLPGRTKMVGYSVRRGDKVMNLLNFASGVDPELWQPERTLFSALAAEGQPVRMITSPKFVNSGLTRAAFRGSSFLGRDTLDDRFAVASAGIRAGVKLQVVYWSDIDHTGHRYGPSSPEWAAALEEFDAALGGFLRSVGPGVSVILTADHGMVDVRERIDIAENQALAEGVELIAGEGRAVHLHAKKGMADRVIERWKDYLADRAWVVPQPLIGELIGEGPGTELVGDAVVFLGGESVVVDSRTQTPGAIAQQGVHGSLTYEEMSIPVWRLT